MYTKKDLQSDIPRIKRKATQYFKDLEESGLSHPEEGGTPTSKGLKSHTVDELKEQLREIGKKVSGTKDELVERLS